MNDRFTKKDLPFLVKAMEHRIAGARHGGLMLLTAPAGTGDKVGGDMTIPEPVTVDVNGTMTKEDYKACSMMVAVCQNMVQKSLTDAASAAGIPAADALKNMNAWVQAYVDFPLPLFNFKDASHNDYRKTDFNLNVDADAVDAIVNIKGLVDLKTAVIGALKKSGGNLASYQGTDRKFNYFGIITGYNATDISVRVIKFQMNLKATNVDSLCVHVAKTNLDTTYDTYQFTADKELMIKLQQSMQGKLIDYMSKKLFAFVEAFYDKQLGDYQEKLAGLLKP